MGCGNNVKNIELRRGGRREEEGEEEEEEEEGVRNNKLAIFFWIDPHH